MPVFRLVALAIAKTFSKLFGLATMTFFGRLPSKDDDKIAIIGVLSLTWPFIVIGAIEPAFGEMIIPFLPDDEALVRGVAVFLAILIPPFNGWLTTRIENVDGSRRTVVRRSALGLLYTPLIGLVVMAIIIVVPLLKISYLFRRIELKSIAVMIHDHQYDHVVDHIQEVLARHGIETERQEPEKIIGALFAMLVWLLGDIYRRTMAKDMTIIRGELDSGGWFEVTLHATDISILGQKYETTAIFAILAEELDQRYLYFSWDDSSQALEDRILECQQRMANGAEVSLSEIADLADDLRALSLESEEWNAIRRHIYGLECEYYKQRAGLNEISRSS